MSLLVGNSRRRKFLLAAVVIAAGGYVSYRIYNSPALARRRRCLFQIMHAMSFCCEAVSESAESLSILSRDLKSYLLSDEDLVPQSLRQAFKIGKCAEVQETVTVLSAALTCGLLRASSGKRRKEVTGSGRGQGQPKSGYEAQQLKDIDVPTEDMMCREIREVSPMTKKHEKLGGSKSSEKILSSNMEKGAHDCQDCRIRNYSSGADLYPGCSCKVSIVVDRSTRGQQDSNHAENFPDRLLSKLFTEPGVGFVSVVAGTFARNLVSALFDAVHNQNSLHKDPGSSSQSSDSIDTDDRTAKILHLMCTNPCKMLIADCIQAFIGTAVTVYIDKTKDVNFYDDMVAGITNPSHKDPMKDIMTSVCNGAIETFIKTSYHVMCAEKKNQNKAQGVIEEYKPILSASPSKDNLSIAEVSENDTCKAVAPAFEGKNTAGVQSFIDGVSMTLAIPSNRKLVVDVVGTMTSEAVKSFVNVVSGTVSSHVQRSWEKLKGKVSVSNQDLQVQARSKLAVKVIVLGSIFLAVWLHILLMGVQLAQKSQTLISLGR